MTPALAACDPSTARIGWASPDGSVTSIIPRAGAEDPARRLNDIAAGVSRTIAVRPPRPDLVGIEGYAYGARNGREVLGEVGGVIRLRLFELDVPYVVVPPASLKRHATGNGNADKARMMARTRELGGNAVWNNDECDAWLLRRMLRQAYQLEPMTEAHEIDAISNLTWPVL